MNDMDDDPVISDEEIIEKAMDDSLKTDDEELPPEENNEEKLEEKSEEQDEEEPETEEIDKGNVFQAIKADFPEFFKKHPEVRAIIGEHQQFASVFASPDEAAEAQKSVEIFNEFKQSVLSGDPSVLVKDLAINEPEALEKFSENFLPVLRDANPRAFVKATLPVLKNVLREISNTAKASKDEQTFYAVGYVNKALFGSPTIPEDSRPDPLIEKQRKAFEDEKKQHETSKQENFKTATLTKAANLIDSIVSKGLDPEKALNDRVKAAITADTLKLVKDTVANDKPFIAKMNQLWKNARATGFTDDAKDKIIFAYLARVKPIIPGIREKVRRDYISDERAKNGTKVGNNKQFIPSSSTSGKSTNLKNIDPNKVDYSNSSDEDILNGKVKLKS